MEAVPLLVRKTVTLVDDYEYICSQDQALHKEDPEFGDKWQKYLDGTAPAPVIPGASPTKFTLRHLSTVSRGRLLKYLARAEVDSSEWPAAAIAAFALGVKDVDGYQGRDGKQLKLQRSMDDGVPILASESINEFEMDVVLEVGGRVMARLNPDPK